MKVLIIEDDAMIRSALMRLLRRMEMVVELDPWAAESAHEAISHLREAMLDKPFDLVLCDWNLKGARTGGDVLAWIRVHATYLEPRFLFLSANEEAQKQGVAWVDKADDVAKLRTAIQTVIKPS